MPSLISSALENQVGDLVHHIAGILRIPEEDLVDGTGFEIGTGVLRQAETKDAGLVLQAGFLDRAADADDVDGGRTLEALMSGYLRRISLAFS